MIKAICPQCHTSFLAASVRALTSIPNELLCAPPLRSELEIIESSSKVRCPKCGSIFHSEAVRFFGFLSPRQFRIFIGLFVAAFLAVVIYALVTTS